MMADYLDWSVVKKVDPKVPSKDYLLVELMVVQLGAQKVVHLVVLWVLTRVVMKVDCLVGPMA